MGRGSDVLEPPSIQSIYGTAVLLDENPDVLKTGGNSFLQVCVPSGKFNGVYI